MQIAVQAFSSERLLHDPAMEVVFLEVQEHQSPVEEPAGKEFLALLREDAVVVREHLLRGFRTEREHDRHRKATHPRDRAVDIQPTFQELHW
jgi:hypothetical protein